MLRAKKMPKKGRSKAGGLDPLSLPAELQTALDALYGHYARTYELWQESKIDTPPVFIVVCNNTSTSKLVYDYIGGFVREDGDPQRYHEGRLALFRNYDEQGNRLARPRTLLIDSEQLESGDALDDNFRDMARDEIERFRRELRERGDPAAAEQEFLYDRPYTDTSIVRVAGPFTVESLSPHRVLTVDADEELQPLSGSVFGDGRAIRDQRAVYDGDRADFAAVIVENLRAAGVQQAHKEGRIQFTSLTGWPGEYIAAEGRYIEVDTGIERRAGILIGPEFGTVARADLVAAAREAGDAGFDVLIACAFNYDAHSAEFERLGRIPILKARMNADLHMAGALANTGAGNLFVIFGEPDIDIREAAGGQLEVEIRGVDVFHPQSGEVRSSGPDDIACWFIDTDYNEESLFVRHAYFLGMNDPYTALKNTLKAEIDPEAWESLYRAVSRPFARPSTGRIAVKVINHLGDEVMKVFGV